MKVVGAIIRNNQGQYLLQLRDDAVPRFKNCWTLFGGRIEEGEGHKEALLRELEEELGLSRDAIKSLYENQVNKDADGTEQYIYEVHIDAPLESLNLGEGAAMEYVSHESLFNRQFAFNIEHVLRRYIQSF